MRIALAQLNPIVGDVAGNTRLVLEAIDRARAEGADLLVTSELALIGYPPRDLLLRRGVVESCEAAVRVIAEHAGDLCVVVGHPRLCPAGVRPFHNSVSVCRSGEVIAVYDKRLLPGYDIFDEDRYFEPGAESCVFEHDGVRIGVAICEDLWRARDVEATCRYRVEPVAELVAAGCELLLSMNASPFVLGKFDRHVRQLAELAGAHALPVVSVNQVGGNDDLVFDGRSLVVGADGSIVRALPGWEATLETVDIDAGTRGVRAAAVSSDPLEEAWNALVLGVRDYVRKTGHERVLLGVSGGIDSALTATIATAALGPANVCGLIMPSRYSAKESTEDAETLAANLKLPPLPCVPIGAAHEAVRAELAVHLHERADGITDENVQARLRGLLLMAFANATGALVLATSNKSEMAVGYTTLYGDMCGAVAVIADLLKTRVYDLARWVNANCRMCGFDTPPIPERSISRPPTAELRPNQTDQDSLPPYERLDRIVEGYVEHEQSADEIVAETGFDHEFVRGITVMIDRAQYKRDQAAVVLKVSPRAFGRGRPMPIVMKQSEVDAGTFASLARAGAFRTA